MIKICKFVLQKKKKIIISHAIKIADQFSTKKFSL